MDLLDMHVQHVHLAATSGLQALLSTDYGYVLIAATVIALELLLIGFIIPGKARSQIFTEEFMKQFAEEHKSATGQAIEKGGYPDMGNGRYASKMNYDQWYRFNSAQRAHYNYVEMAPSTLVWLLISGIYFPVAAAVLGLAVIIFRLIYAIGYANGGPKGRLVGALGNDLALLGLIGLSFASSIMFTKGSSPL